MKRRTVLRTAGVTVTAAIAGCSLGSTDTSEAESKAESRVQEIVSAYGEWRPQQMEQLRTLAERGVWADDEETIEDEIAQLPNEVGPLGIYEFDGSAFVELFARYDLSGRDLLERQFVVDSVTALEPGAVYRSETHSGIGSDGTPAITLVTPVTEAPNRYLLYDIYPSILGVEFPAPEGMFTQVIETENELYEQSNVVVADSRPTDRDVIRDFPVSYATSVPALDPIERASDLDSGETGVTVVDGNEAVIDEQYAAAYAPIEDGDFVLVTHVQVDS